VPCIHRGSIGIAAAELELFQDQNLREGSKHESKELGVAQAYAVRLMQHLVVPTFVLNPKRHVVIWNRACERLTGVAASEVIGTTKHWRAFYEKQRYCLADLVALGRPDKLDSLYPEHTVPSDGLGFGAENWCVMPRLGNQL
jgi:PAS domain-containing protein